MAINARPAAVSRLLNAQQTAYRPAGTAAPRETELVTAPEGSPAMTAREVQDVVRANSAANASAAQAAATNLPTTGMGVTGMGRYGTGNFYNLVGPGGRIADENAAAFVASAPGAYQSPYADAMQRTLNGLLNPDPFSYDVNADGLYQQIKDQYTKAGRQAMMDTQGQSAALTGGYGNSYGAMAGQQAYQESLGGLAGMIPELQQLAYQQWRNGQDDQRNNLEALNKLDAQEFARWQDEQEAYQKLLATLPAAAKASLGGGGGGLNIGLPGMLSKPGFAIDPNAQADLLAMVSQGILSEGQLKTAAEKGTAINGIPSQQLNYFVNNMLGLSTGEPGQLGYDPSAIERATASMRANPYDPGATSAGAAQNSAGSAGGNNAGGSKGYDSKKTFNWVFPSGT